jgi:hypothetical protein
MTCCQTKNIDLEKNSDELKVERKRTLLFLLHYTNERNWPDNGLLSGLSTYLEKSFSFKADEVKLRVFRKHLLVRTEQ